jgi:hypothetical protein
MTLYNLGTKTVVIKLKISMLGISLKKIGLIFIPLKVSYQSVAHPQNYSLRKVCEPLWHEHFRNACPVTISESLCCTVSSHSP